MIVSIRNEEILDFIRERELCSISELSKKYEISKVTVHRVLNDLEADGFVQKVRGGVKYREIGGLEKSFDIRYRRQVREKQSIARTALRYVQEGSSVFLDSATTTIYFAKEIARSYRSSLTVVTDSPIVVQEFLKTPHIQVISTGGDLQYELNTFAGPLAYDAIDKLQFGAVFLSAAAINAERGVMTAQSVLVRLFGKIIERADEVNLLVDHTKFSKIAPLVIAPVTAIDRIITDQAPSDDDERAYAAKGVDIVWK